MHMTPERVDVEKLINGLTECDPFERTILNVADRESIIAALRELQEARKQLAEHLHQKGPIKAHDGVTP